VTVPGEGGLPDPRASSAVLIGVSAYETLPARPAVRANVDDLATLLMNPFFWGLPAERCHKLHDPATAGEVLEALHHAREEASAALVVYLAGHGLTRGTTEWRLAMPRGHTGADFRAVSFEAVGEILQPARAPVKVVIIDSCYSGRVLPALSEHGPAEAIAHQAEARGVYVMTACSGTRQADAPHGQAHTTFTGALLATLRDGVPNGAEYLDMQTVYTDVSRRLRAAGKPQPRQASSDYAPRIALTRNPAAASAAAGPGMPPATGAAPPSRRRATVATAAVLAATGAAIAIPLAVHDDDRAASPSAPASTTAVPTSAAAPQPAGAGPMIKAGSIGEIVSTDVTKCVEALNGSLYDNAVIDRFQCNDGPNQRFTAVATDRDTDFKLQFDHSKSGSPRCLAGTGDFRARLIDCAAAMPWRFDDWGEPKNGWRYWEIKYTGFGAGRCLARPAGSGNDGTPLLLAECSRDPSTQQWRIRV
jgi:uncharacterized caspase-like protein